MRRGSAKVKRKKGRRPWAKPSFNLLLQQSWTLYQPSPRSFLSSLLYSWSEFFALYQPIGAIQAQALTSLISGRPRWFWKWGKADSRQPRGRRGGARGLHHEQIRWRGDIQTKFNLGSILTQSCRHTLRWYPFERFPLKVKWICNCQSPVLNF